jgi:SAM-dependent methyltransferase
MPASKRGRFQGAIQIARFNWPFYFAATVALIGGAGVTALAPMPAWARIVILIGLGDAAFWLCASFLVSHYIYDRSGLYEAEWIRRAVSFIPKRWANFHAGFDEFGDVLSEAFPGTNGTAADFFDPAQMTEPSIERARRLAVVSANTIQVRADHLPFQDNELDAAFVFFSAHELRNPDVRTQFFRELRRVLASRGRLILLEHLRDWPNFLAFGPGFLHFHSRRTWLRAIDGAGLRIVEEFPRTPFVRAFVLSALG